MGSFVSIFWGLANDNVVDPGTGLTTRQKKLIQNTWAIVRKDPISNGTAMMIAFFKKYPEYQTYFPGFKNIPIEELPSNKKFQAHCLNLLMSFNNVINSINDLVLLEANLIGIGERHFRRGQTKEHFLNLKDVILDVLSQNLGEKYTSETSEAWNKMMDATYNGIFQSYSTHTQGNMLMLGEDSQASELEKFYLSPVRLRPIFEPAYSAPKFSKLRSRSVSQANVNLLEDLKPKSRIDNGNHMDEIDNNNNLTEDNSPYAQVKEVDNDSEPETTTKTKKRKSHKNKKNKHTKSNSKSSESISTFEHLCSKLQISFVLSLLGGIILVACCCTLFLRNRIVAFLKKCCPKRKKQKSKKNLFDVEEGDYPYQTIYNSSSRKSNKKKKSSTQMINTDIQDSPAPIPKPQEIIPEPVGCSPCCRKKKKKSTKRRK